MQEDYIEEDFVEEESSSSRRPFFVAVGVLITLFILMGICTAVFLVQNRTAQDHEEQASVIETRNAETLASNAATAVAATETAAAVPTNTPIPTDAPTNTPEPPTATPTSTPVVEESVEAVIGTDDNANEDGEMTATDGETTDETSETAEDMDGETTEAAESVEGSTSETDSGATITDGSTAGESTESADGTLPQTGFDTWGIIVAGLGLVGLLIFARRLRTSG